MATHVEKAQRIIWFIETHSATTAHYCYRNMNQNVLLSRKGITDLKIRIREGIQSVDQGTLSKTRDKLLHHLDIILITNDAHNEHS
jgi:hypothetical protein